MKKSSGNSKTDSTDQKNKKAMEQQHSAYVQELLKEADFGENDKTSMSYHLGQMNSKSLDLMANELREGYMQLKDLSSRCLIDMEHVQKNDKRVFYFKPNSIFLETPEKQRRFRDKFLNHISTIQEPVSDFGLADQLDQEMREAIIDSSLSDPAKMRPFLADFYQRRIYALQHTKYRMLTRWAHFSLTSSTMDRLGQSGTFIYGRLEYEIENAMKRQERLCQKDGYEDLRDGKIQRPETQDINSNNKGDFLDQMQDKEDDLAMHDRSKDPVSCIRMDDFEVYLRIKSYQNKITRSALKFIAKAKWIPTTKNIDILKQFHIQHKNLTQEYFQKQLKLVKHLKERFAKSQMKKTEDLIAEMEEILLEDYPAARINYMNKMDQQTMGNKQNVKNGTGYGIVPKFDVIEERAPLRVQNIIEMYSRIEEAASQYGIVGKVELDKGYAFSYQVQVYFMTYYQKLVIESSFGRYNQLAKDPLQSRNTESNATRLPGMAQNVWNDLNQIYLQNKSDIDSIYDKFNGDFAHDFSEVQKRNLRNLLMVDFTLVDLQNTNANGTSIPLLKKGKKINEQIPDLKKMFSDVRVIRLKRATWVDGEVMIWPKVSETQKRQDATFSCGYYADLQLKALLDFIDVGDPSMVSLLYHSISKIYEKLSKNDYAINYLTEDTTLQSENISDILAKNFYDSFSKCADDNKNENEHKSRISKLEIERMKGNRPINQDRTVVNTSKSSLRELPPHIVQCYLILKHMRIRDSKNRLLHILNFYRSIQKRVVLELQEFSGREVLNNQVKVNMPHESYYIDTKTTNLDQNFVAMEESNPESANQKGGKANVSKVRTLDQKRNEIEMEEDENIATLIDIKRWKYNGQFNNKFLQTCPQAVAIDGQNERPLEEKEYMSGNQMLRQTQAHISEQSKVYLNRIDTYKINEELKEILVVDDFGINVMYDASLQDMSCLEDQLLKIGTYYIKKNEHDFDFDKFEYALVDRIEVLEDLLEMELEYQFVKAQVVLAYMDALEHVCDPLTQQRLMQIIVDVMAWRPKFEYRRNWYFKQSYTAEIRYVRSLLKILKDVIVFQMKNEHKENKAVRDYLNLSFKVADAYQNLQWADTDEGNLRSEINEREWIQNGMRGKEKSPDPNEGKMVDTSALSGGPGAEASQNPQPERQGSSPKKTFVEQLGFKTPDLKDQMINQSALEQSTEDYLDQDANFIKTQEGYPNFFRNLKDSLSDVRFCNGTSLYASAPFGILDFYDSLQVIPNIHAMIKQGQCELKSDLKPAGAVHENLMNAAYLELVYVEMVKAIQQAEGNDMTDYKAQQLIESDLVVSNPDKVIFLIKDMVSTLTKAFKKSLNPLWIAKLDLNTINHFPFPDIPLDYFRNGQGNEMDIQFSRSYVDLQVKPKQNVSHFFPRLRDEDRQINVPPMLLIFCNLVELLRLREHLILCLTEARTLEQSYDHQKGLVNGGTFGTLVKQRLQVDCSQMFNQDLINFVEHGSLLSRIPDLDSGLAIDEICPSLRSNLNFRNPECIQTLTLDAGLNNLKVTFHYQMVQKQLLQTAVQSNHLVMTPYLKVLTEIELLTSEGIKMPNGYLDYSQFTVGPRAKVDFGLLKQVKSDYSSNFFKDGYHMLAHVNNLKQEVRWTIKKEFDAYKAVLEGLGQSRKEDPRFGVLTVATPLNKYTIVRLLHDYKQKLVHVGCRQIQQTIFHTAQKIDLMYVTHQELKQRITQFGGLPQEQHIFKVESSHFKGTDHPFIQMETSVLTPDHLLADLPDQEISESSSGCLKPALITNIPSLKSIAEMPFYTTTQERTNLKYKDWFAAFKSSYEYPHTLLELLVFKNLTAGFELENSMREFVCQIFSQNKDHPSQLRVLKTHSIPSKLCKIYNHVLLLFQFLQFDARGSTKPLDFIEMQDSMDQGRKYWQIDEANTPMQKKLNMNSEDSRADIIEDKSLEIEDETLSSKIIERIVAKKRQQQQIFDDFSKICVKFQKIESKLITLMKSPNFKLDGLIGFLRDMNRIYQLKHFKQHLTDFEMLSVTFGNKAIIRKKQEMIQAFSGDRVNMFAPFYLNGLILNEKHFQTQRIKISSLNDKADNELFKKTVQGLKFQEDLIPMNCALAAQMAGISTQETEPSSPEESIAYNYVGQLHRSGSHGLVGPLHAVIRQTTLGLSEASSHIQIQLFNSNETALRNLLQNEEMGGAESLSNISNQQLIQVLQTQIESLLCKFVYMTILAGKTFPRELEQQSFHRDFLDIYQTGVKWKTRATFEAEIKRKYELATRKTQVEKSQQKAEGEANALVDEQIQGAVQRRPAPVVQSDEFKTVAQIQREEAAKQYLKQQCQRRVLREEMEKLFISASISALSHQNAAISKCLEMCSNRIDKHVHPKQGFCATLFDDVNRHPHLDIVSKFSAIQVFLTKTRNRGLPMRTLTSGQGIVFTFKDLNECLHDFCAEIILFGEKQLKLRTDAYQSQIKQLTEIIQYKDLKLDALKLRSAHIFENIQRVVNSKVFEQGNSLVFALDKAMRDVRFYQDHIHNYENELKHAIYQEFRDKIQTQSQKMSNKDKQIHDMKDGISQWVQQFSIEEQKTSEERLRKLVAKMQNLDDLGPPSLQLGHPQQASLSRSPEDSDREQKSKGSKGATPSKMTGDDDTASAEKAYRVIIMLQERLVEQRSFWDLRYHTMKAKLEERIDFMNKQLSSNQDLWESMKIQDERQKVIQKELGITQKAAQQNEKLIEKLKDENQKNIKSKQILENKNQIQKCKMSEFEYKLRRFDVNKNINVEKLIEILLKQDDEMKTLKNSENHLKNQMVIAENDFEAKKANMKRQIELEMQQKNESIRKNEMLANQLKVYEVDKHKSKFDQMSAVWKMKFDEMFKISQNLIQENKRLKQQLEMFGSQILMLTNEKQKGGPTAIFGPGLTGNISKFNQSQSQSTKQEMDDQMSQTTKTSYQSKNKSAFDQGNLFMMNQDFNSFLKSERAERKEDLSDSAQNKDGQINDDKLDQTEASLQNLQVNKFDNYAVQLPNNDINSPFTDKDESQTKPHPRVNLSKNIMNKRRQIQQYTSKQDENHISLQNKFTIPPLQQADNNRMKDKNRHQSLLNQSKMAKLQSQQELLNENLKVPIRVKNAAKESTDGAKILRNSNATSFGVYGQYNAGNMRPNENSQQQNRSQSSSALAKGVNGIH